MLITVIQQSLYNLIVFMKNFNNIIIVNNSLLICIFRYIITTYHYMKLYDKRHATEKTQRH